MKKLSRNQSGFSAIEAVLIVVIVVLIGVVGGLVVKNNKKLPTASNSTSTATSAASSGGKSQVTDAEVAASNNWKDCTGLSGVPAGATLTLTKTTMVSINLGTNTLQTGSNSTTNYSYWKTLPVVLDNDCKPLKLSDIKAGDTLNVYDSRSIGAGTSTSLAAIQKL